MKTKFKVNFYGSGHHLIDVYTTTAVNEDRALQDAKFYALEEGVKYEEIEVNEAAPDLVYSVKNKSISDYYEPMLIMGETVAEIEDAIRSLPDSVGWSIEKDTLVIRDITEEYYEKERVNEARKAIRRKLDSEYDEHLKQAFYLRDELDFYYDHREYLNYEELHEAYVKYRLERKCNGDEVRYNSKTKHYEWYTKRKGGEIR